MSVAARILTTFQEIFLDPRVGVALTPCVEHTAQHPIDKNNVDFGWWRPWIITNWEESSEITSIP